MTCSRWSVLAVCFWAGGRSLPVDRGYNFRPGNGDEKKKWKTKCNVRLVSWGLPCKLNNCSLAPFRITAVLAFCAQRFNCALLFADTVTFWSNSHLSCFKGVWPLHVWSPQILCCFITRALQREQLHHPHTYALIKHAPRSAFMCSDQPTLPVQPWFWMNLQNTALVLMTKLVFTWWLRLQNW